MTPETCRNARGQNAGPSASASRQGWDAAHLPHTLQVAPTAPVLSALSRSNHGPFPGLALATPKSETVTNLPHTTIFLVYTCSIAESTPLLGGRTYIHSWGLPLPTYIWVEPCSPEYVICLAQRDNPATFDSGNTTHHAPKRKESSVHMMLGIRTVHSKGARIYILEWSSALSWPHLSADAMKVFVYMRE